MPKTLPNASTTPFTTQLQDGQSRVIHNSSLTAITFQLTANPASAKAYLQLPGGEAQCALGVPILANGLVRIVAQGGVIGISWAS